MIKDKALKYLFTATYKDGRVFEQALDDKSITEPETRSSFYDIANDVDKLSSFVLRGEGHEYGVDLNDGHFEIDGIPFFMHEGHVKEYPGGKKVLVPLTDFKLVFFRQHTRSYEVALYKDEQQEVSHDVVFRMGWQCTVDGKNYQEIMQFA